MWKLRASSYGQREPSSAIQYIQPIQTLPKAALVDYVVNRDRRSSKLRHKASFLVADSYSPDPADESSENYLGAPADECVDLKAADYILQRRLSLQGNDYE